MHPNSFYQDKTGFQIATTPLLRGRSMWSALISILVVALLVCGSTQAAGPGAKIYQEMVEKGQIYEDEQWQQYIEDIGERLLAVSDHAGKTYTFTMLDNPGVNAFATPDAYIFINRGVIAYFRSEDELAGVIGHEIGHVLGAHGKRSRRSGMLGNVAGWVGAIMTGTGAVADLTNTVTRTLQSGYGREFELEADSYGADLVAKAGYNPHAMIDGIHVLKDHELFSKHVKKQPAVYHGLFSTHPKNDKRLHELVQRSQHLVPEQLSEPVGDFWEMMDGLVYGDEAATGLIKDGAYYHGALRVVFTFPKDWLVSNTAQEVIGKAAAGGDAYISAQRQGMPKEKQTPEEYVTKTLKRDDVKNGETLVVNGFDAFIGDIEIAAGNAQARKIAIVYKGNNAYVFKGELGPAGDVKTFDQQFRQTVESFRPMTAADVRLANDQRLKVIVAKPGDTYRSLAQNISIKSHAEETLRVLNGHHPNGEPQAGDYVKIIQ